MTDLNARCFGVEDGAPCTELATITQPVPLCTHHQMQVAVAVVPEMLALSATLAKRPLVPEVRNRAAYRATSGARAVLLDLSGVHEAQVYFVRNGDRVKIGYTTHLRGRLSALCLRSDAVLLLLDGGRDLEGALHHRFAEYRVPGTEWFRYAEKIHEYVERKASSRQSQGVFVSRPPGVSEDDAVAAVAAADFRPGPEGEVVVSRASLLRVFSAHMGFRRGVHLVEILRTLHAADVAHHWTVNALSRACAQHDIRVRPQLKVGGQNRVGVHRDDLPAFAE